VAGQGAEQHSSWVDLVRCVLNSQLARGGTQGAALQVKGWVMSKRVWGPRLRVVFWTRAQLLPWDGTPSGLPMQTPLCA
jgi:hypothetical protein